MSLRISINRLTTMILQKLYELYDRLETDDSYDVAPEGYSYQKISSVIVLERQSGGSVRLFDIKDNREGKTRRPRLCLVPGGDKPTGKVTANSAPQKALFLRNDSAFTLGISVSKKDGAWRTTESEMEFESFKARHLALEHEIVGKGFLGVVEFLKSWNPQNHALNERQLELLAEGQCIFQFRDDMHYVHEEPEVRGWWDKNQKAVTHGPEGRCIITQTFGPIARLHEPKFKPVFGAQSSGSPIVAFDKSGDAFCSYGGDKLQGLNAPVAESVVVRYCKALNLLLNDPRHSLRSRSGASLAIGDATVVFWTEKETPLEPSITRFFSETRREDVSSEEAAQDKALLASLQSAIAAIEKGTVPSLFREESTSYYFLGLTGQAGGRIGIRFWNTGTLGELIQRLAKHHHDLAIVPEWDDSAQHPDPRFPTVWQLLDQLVPLKQGKPNREKIPPLLGGELMRSILNETNYPTLLLNSVLTRIRTVERESKERSRRVNYLRAAILKAYLNRNHDKNMTEALDPNRKEPAYHLGRLFAVYETAQKHAHDWKLERTVRETMYSAASATPLSVFGRLERLHHHHTAKKTHPPGSSESYADIVAAIQQRFTGTPLYPASMNLIEQSLFAVGYYHQLHFLRSLANELKNAASESE